MYKGNVSDNRGARFADMNARCCCVEFTAAGKTSAHSSANSRTSVDEKQLPLIICVRQRRAVKKSLSTSLMIEPDFGRLVEVTT